MVPASWVIGLVSIFGDRVPRPSRATAPVSPLRDGVRDRNEPAAQYGSSPDSPLEGNGFELPVPRAMQGRPKAIIAGFGCKPPSLDYLRLPSVEITEGGPKRNLGTEASSRAEPEVRIHFPPEASQVRI